MDVSQSTPPHISPDQPLEFPHLLAARKAPFRDDVSADPVEHDEIVGVRLVDGFHARPFRERLVVLLGATYAVVVDTEGHFAKHKTVAFGLKFPLVVQHLGARQNGDE